MYGLRDLEPVDQPEEFARGVEGSSHGVWPGRGRTPNSRATLRWLPRGTIALLAPTPRLRGPGSRRPSSSCRPRPGSPARSPRTACFDARADETIRIGIGTQDATINCAAGGAVVRELKLLDKYLPHDGKYQNAKYDIVWHNFSSGPPLNNELLANKLDIGNMADFPALLGATAFQTANRGVRTYYIATLSGGVTGAGNAIVVPIQSSVQSLADLKGKRISVPMGSTGHAMLLRAIRSQGWDPERDVTIVSQAPEVAGSALRANCVATSDGAAPMLSMIDAA